jgi:hypothetical protein
MENRQPPGAAQGGISNKPLRYVVAALFLTWMVGGFAYLVYGLITYRGVVKWVAEWELAHLGGYDSRLTFILGVLVLIAPALLLVRLSGEGPGPAPRLVAPKASQLARSRQNAFRVMGVLGLLGLLTALVASFIGYHRSTEPVSYASWNASSPGAPPKRVELVGTAQTAFIITYRETIGGHATYQRYVPVTAADWQPSEPVRYLLRAAATAYASERGPRSYDPRTPSFAITVRGTLLRDELPGVAATALEKAGVKLAPTVWVLDTRAHAEDEGLFLVAGAGGILFLLSAGVLAVGAVARRKQRLR